MDKIDSNDVLDKLRLEVGKYILISVYREENIDSEANFLSLMIAINNIAEHYKIPVIYSAHPKSRKFIERRNFTFYALV